MSFKLFIYYCALCGGWAALLGWLFGRALAAPFGEGYDLLRTLIYGLCLGGAVALGLGMVDALWNTGGRQGAAAFIKGMAAGVIGLAAGIVGGLTGQLLYRATDLGLLQFFGWILTGGLIGASVGLYDMMVLRSKGANASGAIRKIGNGIVGGLLGGVLGSLCYFMIDAMLRGLFPAEKADYLLSRSAWGFVALGLCIGLFIGLAQVILKEAWLKVEAGFRAGREMILSKPDTTIGRAEGCDIALFGDMQVEKQHASIQLKGNRYILVDSGTPGGTFLNDDRITEAAPLKSGDAIRVGNSVLRFGERQKRK
jgi:hypothetical protein